MLCCIESRADKTRAFVLERVSLRCHSLQAEMSEKQAEMLGETVDSSSSSKKTERPVCYHDSSD